MSFEDGDRVVLSDEHSEYDGETGTVTQVVETMFGDANYTIEFEDGQEQGVPADNLEAAPDEAESDDEAEAESDDEAEAESDDEAEDEDDEE